MSNPSYRYSIGCGGLTEWRNKNTEEKKTPSNSPNKFTNLKYKTASNYDNLYYQNSSSCITPLLTRKKFGSPNKIWRTSSSQTTTSSNSKNNTSDNHQLPHTLYDRRLNRSFEAPQGLHIASKINVTRRSTPHLSSDDINEGLHQTSNSRSSSTTSWCCGNFMTKQWKKVHNCE